MIRTTVAFAPGRNAFLLVETARLMSTVLAITGASGIPVGVRLLEKLPGPVDLVLSQTARSLVGHETGWSVTEVEALADHVWKDDDLWAGPSSGSHAFERLIVAPASMTSVARFAGGLGDTLISRIFHVALKEGRRIVIVPRETPLDTISLRNLTSLSELGVRVVPFMPAFYTRPQTVQDMVDFVVARVMQACDLEQDLVTEWRGDERSGS